MESFAGPGWKDLYRTALDHGYRFLSFGDAMLLAPDKFDAIMLDVDNGPDGLVRPENNRLYGKAGLHNARKALAPGGVLAIWSAERDDKFVRRMESVGFTVDEVEVRARYDADGKGKGPRHIIWFATEAEGSSRVEPTVRRASRSRWAWAASCRA